MLGPVGMRLGTLIKHRGCLQWRMAVDMQVLIGVTAPSSSPRSHSSYVIRAIHSCICVQSRRCLRLASTAAVQSLNASSSHSANIWAASAWNAGKSPTDDAMSARTPTNALRYAAHTARTSSPVPRLQAGPPATRRDRTLRRALGVLGRGHRDRVDLRADHFLSRAPGTPPDAVGGAGRRGARFARRVLRLDGPAAAR